jgi:ribosomal protein S18 acetylase RimI-like enzyme
MSIELKVLTAADGDRLRRVAADVFDDPIDPDKAAEFLRDPRHRLVVALDEDVVVGFVSAVVYVHPDKPRPELWINEVGVAPTHHRLGLGRRMLEAMLDLGRQQDCGEAWVLTERSNPAAMRLYAASGGEEAAEEAVMFTFHLDRS